jgi:hypothetical protein
MDSKKKARDYINNAFDYVIKEFIDETDEEAEYELELLVDAVLNKRAGLEEEEDEDETYIAFETDPELERKLNEEDEEDD